MDCDVEDFGGGECGWGGGIVGGCVGGGCGCHGLLEFTALI